MTILIIRLLSRNVLHTSFSPFFDHRFAIHFSLLMTFLSKQPSIVPRVLCVLHCPPDNVLHQIEDYPFFYDPCYYPHDFVSMFATEESVCAWLTNGLQNPCVNCCGYSRHFYHVIVTSDGTQSSISCFFHFFFGWCSSLISN